MRVLRRQKLVLQGKNSHITGWSKAKVSQESAAWWLMGIWLKWARRHHTVGESQCYCVLDMARTQGIVSDQILGIGVGVVGPVDFAWEVLVAPPLMQEWENFSSQNFFKKTFRPAYVVIKNDVNILALGDIGGACVSLLGVMFFGLLLNAFKMFYIDSFI